MNISKLAIGESVIARSPFKKGDIVKSLDPSINMVGYVEKIGSKGVDVKLGGKTVTISFDKIQLATKKELKEFIVHNSMMLAEIGEEIDANNFLDRSLPYIPEEDEAYKARMKPRKKQKPVDRRYYKKYRKKNKAKMKKYGKKYRRKNKVHLKRRRNKRHYKLRAMVIGQTLFI